MGSNRGGGFRIGYRYVCMADSCQVCQNHPQYFKVIILTACLGLVHGDDPERCYGEGGGRGVHVWECMYTRGGFMSMYGKTNTVL